MKLLVIIVSMLTCTLVSAQTPNAETKSAAPNKEIKHWYESFSIRGYVQVRYNRLLETNENLKCEQ